jgi:hypothetical protein
MMSRTTTMTVRLSGALSDFIATKVSEYVRDLIRRGKEWVEQDAFERLMARWHDPSGLPRPPANRSGLPKSSRTTRRNAAGDTKQHPRFRIVRETHLEDYEARSG